MSGYHFERAARIRFAHCDPAGIVYFPQYLVLFNGLVEDWFTDGLGVSYAQMLGPRRIGLPIVKLHCEFSAISRMGDDVQFKLKLERLGNASLTLDLDCWAGDEQRVRSQQVLVFTDLNTHRAMPMPPDVRQAIEASVQQSR
ncbi:acyl-CoA thioesterase [Ralstonia pickettii]|uniref:acyl-CoA thioesterase n=1 Tax=Ralstonia pickettii TaxID=329 RepID=UPI0015B93837|nr:thioesterase family protein [Ralstonia pickettii]NWK47010.1 acyl-CoA thioesterase [Ralstonia pickettii]